MENFFPLPLHKFSSTTGVSYPPYSHYKFAFMNICKPHVNVSESHLILKVCRCGTRCKRAKYLWWLVASSILDCVTQSSCIKEVCISAATKLSRIELRGYFAWVVALYGLIETMLIKDSQILVKAIHENSMLQSQIEVFLEEIK